MMISVCIATYNGEAYIKEQLESIMPQLGNNDEVVISDDGSTDKTLAIINAFNDRRIKIFDNKLASGPIFNFENALLNCQGQYIFLSDQDDFWFDNKVEVMMAALQKNDVVVSDAIIGDGDLNTLRESYFSWRNSRKGFLKNLARNSYLGCCMAFNRKVLLAALPFPKAIPMHDMWIGVIAETFYNPAFISDKLIIYRRHGGNATYLTDDFKSDETILSKFSFRYNLLKSLFTRVVKVKAAKTKIH